jgi:hypothetical protein
MLLKKPNSSACKQTTPTTGQKGGLKGANKRGGSSPGGAQAASQQL